MLLVSRRRPGEAGRTAALIGGIAVPAAAFTVLCMNAVAPTVQIHGALPGVSQSRAYDILVRVPSRVAGHNGAASLARPTDLAELTGGITLTQYDKIRRLPGVQVAAPMTMVGYVPLTVVIPVAVPASVTTKTPALFTVTDQQRADDGLTSVTEPDAGSTYVTASTACPAVGPVSAPAVFSFAAPRLTTCWSTTTGPQPQTWAGRPPATVSVPFARTFLLSLVAVDPAAEAQLLHLDRAVVQGSYLPSTTAPAGKVPVIIASSIDDDQQDVLSLARAPASAVESASGQTAFQTGASAAQPIAAETVTAAQAYRQLLRSLRDSGAAPVPTYWTPSPARYATASDGALTPLPVPADGGYRLLSPHSARSGAGNRGNGAGSVAAALRTVGEFNPAVIASTAATPSPYLGERLSGADTRSEQLLGGGSLGPDGNPAGYPSPGATLVMPMQDISAFANSNYSGADASAPIGSIRIRVTGVTGDDALSRERVRVVAQEIVRATGLHVEVTLAASAEARTIDLPAGRDGLPALRLSEIWYRTDSSTTVLSSVDPRSVALSGSLLLIGAALAASGVMALLRARRRELATLRALGWRRRQVAWRVGREFALIATAAGALAALASYAFEATMTGDAATSWPLLSIPAAAAMTLVAAWWQLRRATAEPRPLPVSAGFAQASLQRRWPAGPVAHLALCVRRTWLRAALGTFVLTVACAALGLELVVRWVFGGVIVGSWLGFAVSWQDDPVDLAAVISVLVLATIAVADISWRNGAERAGELRTLRAMGWSAHGLARLAAREASVLGLAAGVAASAVDVAGIAAVVHRTPASLALVVPAVAAAGIVMSLLAAGLSGAAERIATSRVAG